MIEVGPVFGKPKRARFPWGVCQMARTLKIKEFWQSKKVDRGKWGQSR